MGYRVKWVEENLGVSRKALRIFEEKGLMPKNYGEYRDYSEEDIGRIWTIRVLQGMGFTLSEINNIKNVVHKTLSLQCYNNLYNLLVVLYQQLVLFYSLKLFYGVLVYMVLLLFLLL